MCYEFKLTTPTPSIATYFGIADPPPIPPKPNIFPKQTVAVVGLKADGRTRGLTALGWGLVPGWANDARGTRPFNARAETVHRLPMFRESFARQRCLVPADGFFEGKKPNRVRIGLRGGGLFAFAGLWDVWEREDGKKFGTCCIITTTPNELVKPVHDRMPVLLSPADYAAWLAPGTPVDVLRGLLRPYPAGEMEAALVQ